MKVLKKTRLSFALATAIGGVALLGTSSQVMAIPDVSPGPGAPYVAENGLGQALILPYYTVRAEQRSLINLMNTSGDTLAVKVVIREGKFSRDALNFTILMSPYDVWSGYLRETATGAELVRSSDEDTCVVGAFGKVANNVFTAMDSMTESLKTDGLVDATDTDTLREGYIEIIAQGKVDLDYNVVGDISSVWDIVQDGTNSQIGGDIFSVASVGKQFASYVKHGADGKPGNCQKVAEAMTRDAAGVTLAGQVGTGVAASTALQAPAGRGRYVLDNLFIGLNNGENPIKANFTLLDTDDGVAGGNQAIAIANFNQAAPVAFHASTLASDLGTRTDNDPNHEDLVSAQAYPFFMEPTLASSAGLWNAAGLYNVEAALSSNRLINEWAYNPGTFAETDWVVTFPTKGYHVDAAYSTVQTVDPVTGVISSASVLGKGNIYSHRSSYRANLPAISGGFDFNNSGAGYPIPFSYSAYDREEKTLIDFPLPSPSPYNYPAFPYEVNILTFKEAGATGTVSSKLGQNIDLASMISGTPNGWLTVSLGDGGVVNPALAATAPTLSGLPAVGYMYKVRKQPGAPGTNFGQIVDHSHVSNNTPN